MRTLAINRLVVIVGASLALLLGAVFLQPSLHAEESGIVVGTYEPGEIAQATNFPQKMMAKMKGLQERMQKAQQEGDQTAMQEVQKDAQAAQQEATEEFLAEIEAVMPEVAKKHGVQVVAANVTYTADGVTTKDITQDIVKALSGDED